MKTFFVAASTVAVTLVLGLPRPTSAREVPLSERQGAWNEEGTAMTFGTIEVTGKLVADASGWVVVRTLENRSDVRGKCTVEERVLRTETMPDARVEPPPFAVVDRMQTFELGPREKRTFGVALSPAISAEITAAKRVQAAAELARARAIESGNFENRAVFEQTYMRYDVDYLAPLAPGDTAEKVDNGVMHPAVMPFL